MEQGVEHKLRLQRWFLAVVLLLCAAGGVWLLLSPAAFERRALYERAKQVEAQVHRRWLSNLALHRWRDGLEQDPAVIEKEARKLGYGIPAERVCAIRPADVRKEGARLKAGKAAEPSDLPAVIFQAIAPALMLAIAGILAVLFFTDLRVEDPGRRSATDSGPPQAIREP